MNYGNGKGRIAAEWVGPILLCGVQIIDAVMRGQIIDVVFEKRVSDAVRK